MDETRVFMTAALLNLDHADKARGSLPVELQGAVGDNVHQAQRLLRQACFFVDQGLVDWTWPIPDQPAETR